MSDFRATQLGGGLQGAAAAGYEKGRIAAQQTFTKQAIGAVLQTPDPFNVVGLIECAQGDLDTLFEEIRALETAVGSVLRMPVDACNSAGIGEQTNDSSAVMRLRELRARIGIACWQIAEIRMRSQV